MALHPILVVCLVCLLAVSAGRTDGGLSTRDRAVANIKSLLEKIDELGSLVAETRQFPQQDPLYGYFQAVAGPDGQIDARELQKCLTSSGIAGTYQPFSLETCRLMISMLDRDYSGKMGFSEFKELWGVLNQWKTTFMQHDRDRSGTVEAHELHAAIRSWGYNLSPQALNIIVKRYSNNGKIKFDNFVAIALRLKMLTDHFRRRDVSKTGHATFSYDDFIQVTMYS